MGKNTSLSGKEGEELACRYITEKGFRIIERNYRFHKGEIDIIAKDQETLVFIEVKYRKTLEYGYPVESITPNKVKQIRHIASAYLFERKIDNTACRFDVIAILETEGRKPVIEHFFNAF